MTGETLASVGDTIEDGQPIPGNVTAVRDRDGDRWWRNAIGHFHARPDDDPATCNRWCGDAVAGLTPLTVVEVVAPRLAQAHDQQGLPLWQHLCGAVQAFRHVEAFERPPFHGGCDDCSSGTPDREDWRPLLSEPAHRPPGPPKERKPVDELRALILPVWQEAVSSSDKPDNAQLTRWVRRLVDSGKRDGLALKEAHQRIEELSAAKPRTWAAVEPAPDPDDLPSLVAVYSATGVITVWQRRTDAGFQTRYRHLGRAEPARTLNELRELGEVKELRT